MSKIERILRKKRDGNAWTEEELKFVVKSIHEKKIDLNVTGSCC